MQKCVLQIRFTTGQQVNITKSYIAHKYHHTTQKHYTLFNSFFLLFLLLFWALHWWQWGFIYWKYCVGSSVKCVVYVSVHEWCRHVSAPTIIVMVGMLQSFASFSGSWQVLGSIGFVKILARVYVSLTKNAAGVGEGPPKTGSWKLGLDPTGSAEICSSCTINQPLRKKRW